MIHVTNLFDSDWVAPRYAGARPNVHRKIADHVRSVLGADRPVGIGIDLACGTGLSSL